MRHVVSFVVDSAPGNPAIPSRVASVIEGSVITERIMHQHVDHSLRLLPLSDEHK